MKIGETILDKILGRYQEIREINKDIDYLDKQYENFCESESCFEKFNNHYKMHSDYFTFIMFDFQQDRYLRDKGEKELIKELSIRRKKRYDLLKDILDVSKCSLSQLRRKKLERLI